MRRERVHGLADDFSLLSLAQEVRRSHAFAAACGIQLRVGDLAVVDFALFERAQSCSLSGCN